MIGIARAPGTCGELVQGKVDGVNFLVTCPVNMYSQVTVKLNTSGAVHADRRLPKVKLAVEKTLRLLGRPEMGADVFVMSSIPWGKGMASSSADIVAASTATAVALGTYITPAETAGIALSIEPTDGVMFPGITLFDHVEGSICRGLGQAPDLEAVIVDLGGTVDTLKFNANTELHLLNKMKEPMIMQALSKIEKGLTVRDLRLVGEAATESALANQHMLFKPELEQILAICLEAGGVGVNVGHSGTVVGLLFERDRNLSGKAVSRLMEAGFCELMAARIIDGGAEVLQEGGGDEAWLRLDIYTEEICGKLRKITG